MTHIVSKHIAYSGCALCLDYAEAAPGVFLWKKVILKNFAVLPESSCVGVSF